MCNNPLISAHGNKAAEGRGCGGVTGPKCDFVGTKRLKDTFVVGGNKRLSLHDLIPTENTTRTLT